MPVYLTEKALTKLKADIHHARTVERKRISNEIAEARAHGDLSENAEYDAAKEAQGKLEARIAQMENTLAEARVLDEDDVDASKARILSTVRFRNSRTGKEKVVTLVSAPEADISNGRIPITSPIGKGLLGKGVGEEAVIHVPAGELHVKILEITRNGQ
ncbi:MAG: transcription elongation factor GreA [Rhodothermaceae bacterium]|nr:transcription elongation factor GreA [Rhodothermaceae bacterium]MXW33454.1 transcription elongation factor GreA [Rhodothermaceae bacterium]MXZ17632.1 transcription elongation factor GreA [Rhodothermaceae bacterium]MYC04808.1 transcription elongation factor GreA [Rhodothermaceae bacterium]MYE63940.1 transcription elongation factor GreA [Rhodothermaceae bacterium]